MRFSLALCVRLCVWSLLRFLLLLQRSRLVSFVSLNLVFRLLLFLLFLVPLIYALLSFDISFLLLSFLYPPSLPSLFLPPSSDLRLVNILRALGSILFCVLTSSCTTSSYLQEFPACFKATPQDHSDYYLLFAQGFTIWLFKIAPFFLCTTGLHEASGGREGEGEDRG